MKKNGEEICHIGNWIIDNRHKNSSVYETKLFYLAVSKINPQLVASRMADGEFIEAQFPIKQVLSILSLDEKKINRAELTAVIRKMAKTTFPIIDEDDENSIKEIPAYAMCEYSEKIGYRVLFNKRFEKYLLKLVGTSYTQILFHDVISLSSDYSIRLLEIVTKYVHEDKNKSGSIKKVITKYFTVGEIVKRLEVPKSYLKPTTILRTQILDRAVEEINNIGHYHIELQQRGGGRGKKIEGFDFVITLPDVICNLKNIASNDTISAEQPARNTSNHVSDDEYNTKVKIMKKCKVDEKYYEAIAKFNDVERMTAGAQLLHEYIDSGMQINNPGAMFLTLMKDKTRSTEQIAAEAKELHTQKHKGAGKELSPKAKERYQQLQAQYEQQRAYYSEKPAAEGKKLEISAPEPVENVSDPEPPTTPEQTVFDEIKVTKDARKAAAEQREILAQFSEDELDMIKYSIKFREPLDDELKAKVDASGVRLFFIYRLLRLQEQK